MRKCTKVPKTERFEDKSPNLEAGILKRRGGVGSPKFREAQNVRFPLHPVTFPDKVAKFELKPVSYIGSSMSSKVRSIPDSSQSGAIR